MNYPTLLLLLLSMVVSQASLAALNTSHLSKHTQFDHLDNHCACFDENSQRPNIQLTSKGINDRQAASIAKKAYGGSVINVSRKGNVYRVKLMKDGRVRIVKVDAATGKIVKK